MNPIYKESPLLKTFLEREKKCYSRSETITKIGRFLTFRELQLLHKKRFFTDWELGFYMDIKSNTQFTINQINKILELHTKLDSPTYTY